MIVETEYQPPSTRWRGLRRDTFWQMAERGTRAALGFVVSVAIARNLGPDGFGLYSYALATVALFAFLAQAGLDALLIRELVRAPQRATSILAEGLALRFAGAMCAGLASIAAAMLAAPAGMQASTPLVAILALAGLLQSGWVAESWLQANHCFADATRAKIIAYTIGAAMRLGSLMLPTPLIPLAIVSVVEAFAAVALLWRASQQRLELGFGALSIPDRRHTLALARLASPMLLSAFATAIYSRIDVFMLGRMLGGDAVGLYSAGTMLSEGLYLVPAAVMAAVAPRLASLYLQDRAAFDAAVHGFLRLLSVSGLLMSTGVTLLAPYAISLLFRASYSSAAGVLQIHVWSTWAVFLSCASDPWYINHDLRRFYLMKTSVAAILNICLNFALIPRFGINGAAWATVVSYTVSALGMGVLWKTTRPLFRLQSRAILGLPGVSRVHAPTDDSK
jgi:PST family polysaccharide transporter